MTPSRRSIIGFAVATLLGAGTLAAQHPFSNSLPTTTAAPDAYGTQRYGRTYVNAVSFYPSTSSAQWGTSGSLGRTIFCCGVVDFYANLDLPEDVIIDYIGLNHLTDAPAVIGVALHERTSQGALNTIASINSVVHAGWQTDYNQNEIGFLRNSVRALILHVQGNSQANSQFFGWVEVWWKRRVSPAGPIASYDDVPVGHPQRPFIEALAFWGITAGCGGNNFCPDQPLTRGQMAVFLAVALGL
jgi:hypothetical protein